MPKVGDKHFPYTEEGMRMAEEYSQMTGLPIEYEGEGGSSDLGDALMGGQNEPR